MSGGTGEIKLRFNWRGHRRLPCTACWSLSLFPPVSDHPSWLKLTVLELTAAQRVNVVIPSKAGAPIGELLNNLLPLFNRNAVQRRLVVIPFPFANFRDQKI